MFGKTLRIDMAYTWEHGVLRILIGCLNYRKIPPFVPMLIKGRIYELYFHVEGEEVKE